MWEKLFVLAMVQNRTSKIVFKYIIQSTTKKTIVLKLSVYLYHTTAHGKNACDCIDATLKRGVAQASLLP